MKKLISLLLGIAMMMTMGASLAEGALVTYFSHAGENYNVGVVEEGNTAKLAKVIAEQTGADLFEIVPVVDYPQSYDECLEVATAEQREGARPEYMGDVENWDQYDTIFIGYPIWWGEIPTSCTPSWRITTSPERRSSPSTPTKAAASPTASGTLKMPCRTPPFCRAWPCAARRRRTTRMLLRRRFRIG